MASINDLATAAIASVGTRAGDGADTEAGPMDGVAATAENSAADGSAVARGALVILEGMDRSGKTTQVKLLEQRFVELGRKVKVMRFPDRSTPIGQMIDAYLKSAVEMDDHVIHLLFSANRWEAVKQIRTLLAAGTTIICDRYYHSGVVYSAAKQNPALSLHWARAPELGLPRPDLVLFLDLDEAAARARGGWGAEVYERGEMQKRVRDLFWGLAMGRIGADGALGDEDMRVDREFRQEEEDLVVVDAGSSVEDVAEAIWEKVRPRVEMVERGELGGVVRSVS
ncbi:thymidylate kinase [Plectosphaerella cucumerina]|uniref:Thymidylate kinase n=1 Tax=Plectosphaerella cucumerina TaxID=40658 RepID=A0A8K0TLP4_9PEZI|nr:thymidylate kinase [Plectosphaerella cucumerina]